MPTKLTDTLVRSLTPPERGQRVVWDGALPRFGLRLAAGGSRSWVIKYMSRSTACLRHPSEDFCELNLD